MSRPGPKRQNRYAMISHVDLVERALEMKREITYRKAKVARELKELERAEKMFRNLGAVRLAQACGADGVVVDAMAEISDPDIADRTAQAIADRRWNEAHTHRLHSAETPHSAEGAVG